MEVVVSAIIGELISRFISFLIKNNTNQACPEEKLERLRHLLLRVHSVVEEAEGRCITNAGMLVQLNLFVSVLYQGYSLLDTIKYRPHEKITSQQDQVTRSCSLVSPVKRFRITHSLLDGNGIQSVLENLETAVANMTEFVILLAGCERMYRTPYDSYLYIDNFMFGRAVQKQQIANFLLQDVSPTGTPAVLPIIGGSLVGKKTLVGHACQDERVLSHFPSILQLTTDDIWRKGHQLLRFTEPGRILVVVEFFSDVDDDCWEHFYSAMTSRCRGSKVVIISKLEAIARFGTVKPVCLKNLPHEEYVYFFKVLAFGSANPDDHPQLASIGIETATLLHGGLITANVVADMLRKNLNTRYWLHIQQRFRNMVEDNLSVFHTHPKRLLEKDHPWTSPDWRRSTDAGIGFASCLRIMANRVLDEGNYLM
ncbi:uncharacterized protein LOC100826359 isoform X2 [Brachypodium distachyon]|uniref:uncharacterized protein LOC100826359 isoform X2 n=1 Tax=Brachypodium distachyon TaxID=15368 RepID=UPI0001C737DA|nr:uncharacterized protein LOC100826359 isoform X2 [Brachypodium distachyon]|eukprot:XP_010234358.1 uncharacterized protein LOC100826359 isoform X2 [Brachypodium distachyon]